MIYNPDIHHRGSIRLKKYDYSQAGLYFVTICCDERKCRFGRIENDAMIMNEYGIMAHNEWIDLTKRFALDPVPPNENNTVGATLAVARDPVTPVAPNENNTVGATLAVARDPVTPNTVAIRAFQRPIE